MRLQIGPNKYAAYYPQERPLEGRPVKVWNEDGEFLGVGIAGYRKSCGGVITVNGKTFDSNHILHWEYE